MKWSFPSNKEETETIHALFFLMPFFFFNEQIQVNYTYNKKSTELSEPFQTGHGPMWPFFGSYQQCSAES